MSQYVLLVCTSLWFIYSLCYGCGRICFKLNENVSCFVQEYSDILFMCCQVKCIQNLSPEFRLTIHFSSSFVDVYNVINFIYRKFQLIVFTEIFLKFYVTVQKDSKYSPNINCS
jgi:hypothetical protein